MPRETYHSLRNQPDRLTGGHDLNLNLGCQVGGVLREGVRRVRQEAWPRPGHAQRAERAPVNGHRQARLQQPQRLSRPFRVEVALAQQRLHEAAQQSARQAIGGAVRELVTRAIKSDG